MFSVNHQGGLGLSNTLFNRWSKEQVQDRLSLRDLVQTFCTGFLYKLLDLFSVLYYTVLFCTVLKCGTCTLEGWPTWYRWNAGLWEYPATVQFRSGKFCTIKQIPISLDHWAGGLHCGYCLGNVWGDHMVVRVRSYTASRWGGHWPSTRGPAYG